MTYKDFEITDESEQLSKAALATALAQIERQGQADRRIVDALLRFRAVAAATGHSKRVAWSDERIAAIARASQARADGCSELGMLGKAVVTYITACQDLGYDEGLARGKQMRAELLDWASPAHFYAPL